MRESGMNRGDPPRVKQCEVEHIPERLKREGRFCCWKYARVGDRWTKAPVNPLSGRRGNLLNRKWFSDFTTAADYQRMHPDSGMGVIICDHIAGIDIDDCKADNGQVTDFADYVLDTIESYAEISPSGHGIHIFFAVPDRYKYDSDTYYIKHPQNGLEIYTPGMKRFITLTGDTITPFLDIEDCSAQLPCLLDRCMKRTSAINAMQPPVDPLNISDSDLLDRIRNSQDQKTNDLLDGFWQNYDYSSQSEADEALLTSLAFWTRKNPEQMERLFTFSKLADRSKWKYRPDYRRISISHAIERCEAVYDPDYGKHK